MLKLSKHIVLNTVLLTFVLTTFSFFSTAQNNEEKALQFFEDGKYIDALPIYQELNVLYPNDYIIQYNYGVCLTETNNYGNKARKLLLQASQNEVPLKVFFYIGKNYHALNDFKTANIYYSRFDGYAKKKSKKALEFNQIWEKCKLNINPFVLQDEKPSDTKKEIVELIVKEGPVPSTDSIESNFIKSQQLEIDPYYSILEYQNPENQTSKPNDIIIDVENETIIETHHIIELEQKATEEVEIKEPEPFIIPNDLLDTTLNFILSSEIYYQHINQFKTEKGKKYFIEGWNNSIELKSLLKKIDLLRNDYKLSQSQTEKTKISEKVLALEIETIQLKSSCDIKFLEARSAELGYWDIAAVNELSKLIAENDSLNQIKTEPLLVKEEKIILIDTIDSYTDTIITEQEPVVEKLPNIFYKIQIGAYSKGLPEYIDVLYKKLSVLRKIEHYTDDRGIVVYTIGELTSFGNAIKLQNQIRQEGIKDAFVVAYNNGKRITLKEAKEITNNE